MYKSFFLFTIQQAYNEPIETVVVVTLLVTSSLESETFF